MAIYKCNKCGTLIKQNYAEKCNGCGSNDVKIIQENSKGGDDDTGKIAKIQQ